jgi:hypothetical protein
MPMGEIGVSRQNYDLLRRLDEDRDGTIVSTEANHAIDHAGIPSEVNQQLAALLPADRVAVDGIRQHPDDVLRVTFGGRQVSGQGGWNNAERQLQQAVANTVVTPGTQGQGRVSRLEGEGENNDCGQTVGQYLHARRLQASGQPAPAQTYGQADDAVARDSFGAEGSSASNMQQIQQRRYGTVGNTHYTFQRDMFTNANEMEAALRRGLQTDPAGAMVPINYRSTDTSDPAPHWIAVTSIEPNGTVHYFDPGGVDGSQHERTMTLSELRGAAVYDLPQIGVVYGSPDRAGQTPHLANGSQLSELEVRLGNRSINVTDYVGSFPTQKIADQQARIIANREGMDAMVVREGDRFAVYGTTEIRTKFGGLWSDNTLTAVNPNVTSAFMTDPQTKHVRAAQLPGH